MVKFDFNSIHKELMKGAEKATKIAEPVLLQELKANTPEDTKEMLNSYVSKTTINNDSVENEITNTVDYVLDVEYGKGTPYNYHKPKGSVFYNGVGNRTFARSVDNKRNEITNLIANNL